jgi:Activator of Hsp90 ATPase homolog 1-like protein
MTSPKSARTTSGLTGKMPVQPSIRPFSTRTAVAPEQVGFLERAGMPLTTEQRVIYDDVVSHRRLAYTSLADFIPGVAPYDLATVVELHAKGQGVRMVLTIDAQHDERWTKMAVMGWESQLGKLAKVIAENQPRAGR